MRSVKGFLNSKKKKKKISACCLFVPETGSIMFTELKK